MSCESPMPGLHFSEQETAGLVQHDSRALDLKMQKTRALVTSCCFLIGAFAYVSGAVAGHLGKVLPAIAIMPASSLLAMAWIARSRFSYAMLTASSLAMDILIISWVIAWTGGLLSPCLPFYLTPVMAASFRFGPWGSIVCALVSLAGYLAAGLGAPPVPLTPQGTPSLALRIVILFTASGFGIVALHRKLERYRREKVLRKELEKANRDLGQAYRDLQSAQDQLLHAEKLASIGGLVAGVAHEINNPISFVYGNLIHLESYIDRLKFLLALDDELRLAPEEHERREEAKAKIDYDYLRQDLERALADCRNGADRIRRIVEALLRFSRVGRGECRRVTLAEPVENALYLLGGRIASNIQIIRAYDTEAAVAGDSNELSQVFLNIVANAADAVSAGGTITVRTLPEAQPETAAEVVVEIEDNGPGIPPELHHRIFEPFFTTKEVGRGTGLGLSVAYSIIKHHLGSITFSCPAAGGTLFRISLPAWTKPPLLSPNAADTYNDSLHRSCVRTLTPRESPT